MDVGADVDGDGDGDGDVDVAQLDVMTAMGVVDPDRDQRGLELFEWVVEMLTKR